MRSHIIIFLLVFTTSFFSQKEFTISYLHNPPFVIKDSSNVSGIEIDIINEYILWLKTTKKLDFTVKYEAASSRDEIISLAKNKEKNVIGAGSFIAGSVKDPLLVYSENYLKNLSFCITNGNAPNIKSKTKPEVYKVLSPMTALTINGSNLSKCIDEIKKLYVPDLKIINLDNHKEILHNISKNILNFGYVNAIDFWVYLKENPNKFLKVQKSMDQTHENYSLLFQKSSEHKLLFDEFFKTFKTGTKYRMILEKYVGGFMAQNIAIK